MTQSEINNRATLQDDQQFRRHLIAMLRIVESRMGIESSLNSTIGKGK